MYEQMLGKLEENPPRNQGANMGAFLPLEQMTPMLVCAYTWQH